MGRLCEIRNDLLGEQSELDIAVLRSKAQQFEGSVGVHAVDEHEHALGLFDDGAVFDHLGNGGTEVVGCGASIGSYAHVDSHAHKRPVLIAAGEARPLDGAGGGNHAEVWGNTCFVPLVHDLFNR
jgi:hypothetical protein